jgi:hypothetical protein
MFDDLVNYLKKLIKKLILAVVYLPIVVLLGAFGIPAPLKWFMRKMKE